MVVVLEGSKTSTCSSEFSWSSGSFAKLDLGSGKVPSTMVIVLEEFKASTWRKFEFWRSSGRGQIDAANFDPGVLRRRWWLLAHPIIL
jgi:hypothetical protein